MKFRSHLPWLAYLTLAIVWGTTYFAIALAIQSFTPMGLVGIRFLSAGLLMALLGWYQKESWPTRQDLPHLVLVGVLLLTISNALVVYAEHTVSSGLTAILCTLGPIWMALFSLGKEPLPPKAWLGILLGFAGVVVLSKPVEGHSPWLGMMALFVAPAIWSFGAIHGKGRIKGSSLFLNVAVQMTSAGLVGLGTSAVHGGILHAPLNPTSLSALLYLILFGSALAYTFHVYLLKQWTAARAGSYGYLNPIVAVILGCFWLNEAFPPRMFAGTVLVLVGIALVQWPKTLRFPLRRNSSEIPETVPVAKTDPNPTPAQQS